VILAFPRGKSAAPTTSTPIEGPARLEVEASVERRQVGASPENLDVRVIFGEDAEWLRIGLYYPHTSTGVPEAEAFAPNLNGPRRRKGQRTTLPLPLREGLKPGCYRVEAEPCGPGAVCGKSAVAMYKLRLPQGTPCQGP
jgi:hypothetical protein